MRNMLICMMLCFAFGCDGFLDEVDQDKMIPTKTEHYASVLLNCIKYDYPIFYNVDYMTDNVTEYSYATESNRKAKKPAYTWQLEIELDEDGEEIGGNELWSTAYKNIAVANYVIELVDDAEGSEEEKLFIKGEAYFLRALCYFNLLNIYGRPYDAESSEYDLGVPLRLGNGINQTYQRATVAECYRQIEDDLAEASRLLMESGIIKSVYHPSQGSCALLLSRVCLYQGKWEKTIEAASEAMKYGSLSRMATNETFLTEDNTELLYSGMFYSGAMSHDDFEDGWQVAPELLVLYDRSNDLRFACFFSAVSGKIGDVYYSNKVESSYSAVGQCNMRLAEAYLNRAEAYVRLNMAAEAAQDMIALLETRYSRTADFEIPDGEEELLEFIWRERRKELCFEEHHRWFDLRRMAAAAPQIEHAFTITDDAGTVYGTQYFTLFPEDLNYTLPIPLDERENNPLIQNNERYDKLPETEGEIIIP